MSSIKGNLEKLQETLKEYPNVRIVAATKYVDVDKVKELIDCGIKDLGENRTDVFLEKYENEDKDFFYKLNYSLFFKLSVLDSDRITIVDEYLNDIGGK